MDSLSNEKVAKDDGLNELIAKRWSPRAFADKKIEPEKIKLLFQAASWAASAFNEQPWRYIIGNKSDPEQYDKVLKCLGEWNQGWAKSAPLIILVVVSTKWARNGKPNETCDYDCGQASASMAIQATYMGLHVHQMTGIPEKVTETFGVPEDFKPLTAIAVGYLGSLDSLSEDLQNREKAPRTRKEPTELVFASKWGTPYK